MTRSVLTIILVRISRIKSFYDETVWTVIYIYIMLNESVGNRL